MCGGSITGEERFRQLIELHVKPTDHVMDLGCGTGEFTLAIASLAGQVTGVDVSRKRIDAAKVRLAESGVNNVTFAHAAGQDLVFPEDAFDVALSRYGPLGLTDFLDEARRVVKPGGILLEITAGENDACEVQDVLGSEGMKPAPGKKERLRERLLASGCRVELLEDVVASINYETPEGLIRELSQTYTVSATHRQMWADTLKAAWRELTRDTGILTVERHWLVWLAYNEKS